VVGNGENPLLSIMPEIITIAGIGDKSKKLSLMTIGIIDNVSFFSPLLALLKMTKCHSKINRI